MDGSPAKLFLRSSNFLEHHTRLLNSTAPLLFWPRYIANVRRAHNGFCVAVISSTRNPVSAKQKLSPLPSRGWLVVCLFLGFLSACLPVSLKADALEEGVRALARRVVADHSLDRHSSYSWQNHSSLPSSYAERLRKTFEEELDRLRNHLEYNSPSDLEIQLRDGPSLIYLMATISGDDSRLVASIAIPKSQLTLAEPAGSSVKLARELLWQQPEPILDVAQFDYSGKPQILLVLSRTALSFYQQTEKGWVLKDSALLPHQQPPMRDLRGEIHLTDHFFQFHLPGVECDGDAIEKVAFECEESKGIWRAEFDPLLPFSLDPGNNFFAVDPHYIGPKKFPLKGFYSAASFNDDSEENQQQTALAGNDGHTYVYASAIIPNGAQEAFDRLPVEWGSSLISVQTNCRDDTLVLAAGAPDYASADSLQGFAVGNRSATAVTPILELPGPILSLHDGEDSDPIAVIFNLTSGNYEAYRVKVTCAN